MSTATENATGQIAQIMGAVIDVKFADGHLPNILSALKLSNPTISEEEDNLTLEVSQHLGDNVVRCIAMDTTDGLVRGAPVRDTGDMIKVPVGTGCLGRVMNLLGDPIDHKGPVETESHAAIHRDAPAFDQQDTADNVLVTGIKVVDLLAPYKKGGKIGLFGGAGVGKTVLIQDDQ